VQIDLGGGFIVREFRSEDVPSLVRHANNEKVARNLEDRFPHPYGATDAEEWLEHVADQDPVTDFAIATTAELIGGIGFHIHQDVYRCTAELGYWLGETYWGRGIATRAVRSITVWAFASFPLERIQARVFATNPASCRVLEKSGYTSEGRLRHSVLKINVLMDQVVYAILRHESPTQ
jgi:ribosomal-protein-alanine N-acetyltransferase